MAKQCHVAFQTLCLVCFFMFTVTFTKCLGNSKVSSYIFREISKVNKDGGYWPGVATFDLNGGTCEFELIPEDPSFPFPYYSNIISHDQKLIYSLRNGYAYSPEISTWSINPLKVLTTVNLTWDPNPPNSTPVFYLNYDINGAVFGWRQSPNSRPYTYSLLVVNPEDGETVKMDSSGCDVPGPYAIDKNQGLIYMYKSSCNFGYSNMYVIDSYNGTVLDSYGMSWFTIYSLVRDRKGVMYASACKDNDYGSFWVSYDNFESYYRLQNATTFGCYSPDMKPRLSGIYKENGDDSFSFLSYKTWENKTAQMILLHPSNGSVFSELDFSSSCEGCLNLWK